MFSAKFNLTHYFSHKSNLQSSHIIFRYVSLFAYRVKCFLPSPSSPGYGILCPNNTCVSAAVIDPNDWLKEMEEFYVKELHLMHGHCDQNHLLSCQSLEAPRNTTANTSTNSLQPIRYYNVLNVSEDESILKFMHEKCRCDPDVAIEVEANGKKVCLAKVGTPCRYRLEWDPVHKNKVKDPVVHGNEYSCVDKAVCFAVLERNPQLPSASVENTTGYEINGNGKRQAMVIYILDRLTHVCICDSGFYDDGRGNCIVPPSASSPISVKPPPILILLLYSLLYY